MVAAGATIEVWIVVASTGSLYVKAKSSAGIGGLASIAFGAGLQLTGYTNPPVGIVLMILGVILAGWAIAPSTVATRQGLRSWWQKRSGPPFLVGLAPDGADKRLYEPQPDDGNPATAKRTAPVDIGIIVTYEGRRSAADVEYFYVFSASAQGHPSELPAEDEATYAHDPRTGQLVASVKKRYQHRGTAEHHTMRISFPYEQRCQPLHASIHALHQRPFTARLHLLMGLPGFPNRLVTVEEMRGWQCQIAVAHQD